ncbi:MAG: SBBP repeat-containing protein [Cyanobacteriota bacterium]
MAWILTRSNPASDFAPTRNPANLRSVLWTQQFGTHHDDWATSMAVDQQGNILVSGYTEGTLPDQAHSGRRDAFVRKYDPEGNELWTRQFGTGYNDWAVSVAVDGRGDILVAGFTRGTLPGQMKVGEQDADAFVRKYDSDGNELWTHQFGTESEDKIISITADERGNILVSGLTSGALPGQTHLGGEDAFVRKYDSEGNELWTRQFGTREDEEAWDITVDGQGNVLVAGPARPVKAVGTPLCASTTPRATNFGLANSKAVMKILQLPLGWTELGMSWWQGLPKGSSLTRLMQGSRMPSYSSTTRRATNS